MERLSQIREHHQEQLAQIIDDLRQRAGAVRVYVIGGYCTNPHCEIRDVVVKLKDYDRRISVRELRCPSCRQILQLGAMDLNVGALTQDEYRQQRAREARVSVAEQLDTAQYFAANPGQKFRPVRLSDVGNDISLDALARRFRAQRTWIVKPYDGPATCPYCESDGGVSGATHEVEVWPDRPGILMCGLCVQQLREPE